MIKIVKVFSELLGTRKILLMLTSSITVSLIEFAGLALIFPFIKMVTDPEFLALIANKLNSMGLPLLLVEHRSAILICGVVMISFYLVKGVLHAKLIRYQANVAADINRLSSQHLIEHALNARYQLFLNHGAVKIAGISYSNTTHTALLFQALVAACNELILLGLVFFGIVLLSPFLSISVLLLMLGLAFACFLPLSRRVAKIGHATQKVDHARHRFVFAMASAIRDIKIMGLEQFFIRRNEVVVREHVKLNADYVSISAIQRIAVEVIMVCAVVIGCMWLGFSGLDLVQIAPILATIGLVVVRAAPSLSRLANASNGFRYSLPFVEGLLAMREEVLHYPQPRQNDLADFSGDYVVDGLSFGYSEKLILKDVSMCIPKGKVVAIVGTSGSGKSTLLDLLAGLQPPTSGVFRLSGRVFKPFLSRDFSSGIGYVSQSIALLDASLEFNIALEDLPDPERMHQAIYKANLSSLLSSLPHGLATILGEGGQGVSGGQRQRIGIARALYREPAILILDEVTSALDLETEAVVMKELLRLRGHTTLLIVTHRLEAVKNADRIYRLESGKLWFEENSLNVFLDSPKN